MRSTQAVIALLLLAAAPLPGCHLIFRYEDTPADGAVVIDGPWKKEGGTGPLDMGKQKDKGKPKDHGDDRDKDPDGSSPSCPAPLGVTATQNSTAKWTVALDLKSTNFAPVSVHSSLTNVYVNSVDHPDEASGFIISMPSSATSRTTLLDQALERLNNLAKTLSGRARLITSGVMKTNHEGAPLLAGLRVELTVKTAIKPPELRKKVAAGLLNKDQAYLGSWYNISYKYPAKKSFVVALAILLRTKDKRAIITGSVAATERATERAAGAGIALDDMSNGTNLAGPTATLKKTCRTWTLKNQRPMADIIWVMDESGSMAADNGKVAGKVAALFKVANRYELDMRMGVTGMIAATKPTTNPGSYLGKLCSSASSDPSSAGGTDRFLTILEQGQVAACLKNPPYYEGGAEYGLANAYKVVTNHLPRSTTVKQDQIRVGAELAIIAVTDEAPQEIKKNFGWYTATGFLDTTTELKVCSLGSASSNAMTPFLKQWTTLFTGKNAVHGNEAAARFYLLADSCQVSCTTATTTRAWETPWGYQELSRDTGGQQASLCLSDVGPTLEGYMEDITGAASPLKFSYTPVSASLRVKYGSTWLKRSRDKGFDYRGASNTVVLVDQSYLTTKSMTAAFSVWK